MFIEIYSTWWYIKRWASSIETEDPCEHCYCIQGKMVCAVESCMGEMDGEADHCDPIPPAKGECCPTEYRCGKFFVICIV